MQKGRGDSRLRGPFGPGVGLSRVSDWLRARLRKSVSVPRDRIQKSAIHGDSVLDEDPSTLVFLDNVRFFVPGT